MRPTPAPPTGTTGQGISLTVFSWELVPGRTGVIVTVGAAIDSMVVMEAAIVAGPITAGLLTVDLAAGLRVTAGLPVMADLRVAANPRAVEEVDHQVVAEANPAVAAVSLVAVAADPAAISVASRLQLVR